MEKIKEFLRIELGYGDGSGYGDGYGSGDGSGYGYGDGSGYGDGYGDGSGYGDGYGDGYGSGDGVKTFNNDDVYEVDGVQTIIKSVKGNCAKGFILNNDLTLTPCFVVKAHNCFAHGETIKKAQEALENKLFEDMDVDEKINLFKEKFSLDMEYPVKDFYDWHNKLTGSCEMGRKAFAKDHDIDIESDTMTVVEFVNLTKNSFGGSIIQQLAEELKIEI